MVLTDRDEPTQDTFEQALRAQFDERMTTGRNLANAVATYAAKQRELETAHASYADASTAATKAGWTETELRKVFKSAGITPPPATSSRDRRTARQARTGPATDRAVSGKATTSLEHDNVDGTGSAITDQVTHG